jgi:acyl-CoA thioester hydrolase
VQVDEFQWPIRVYYEDTDSGGVVYYANYLKFFERARTEWLRALGFEQDVLLHHAGVIFAVTSVQLDYRRPARFNDALVATARVVAQRRASLAFAQLLKRGDETLCEGLVKIACLDAQSFRPCAMPDELMRGLVG